MMTLIEISVNHAFITYSGKGSQVFIRA